MAEKKIYFAKGDNPKLIEAYQKAQDTFGYFWRELYWEGRRIIPALDMASVKVAFTQEYINEDGEEDIAVEHMWIGDIYYDGEYIYGELLNEPGQLTNIEEGDEVAVTLDQISDWLFLSQGRAYGGFTIQAMRSEMEEDELKGHDEAWGIDFGDPNTVVLAYEEEEHPENLVEHPMSKNMRESFIEFLDKNPDELDFVDDSGLSFLHREVLAGNLTIVEVLLEKGVDKNAKTPAGKTALDFAKQLNWKHLIPVLS